MEGALRIHVLVIQMDCDLLAGSNQVFLVYITQCFTLWAAMNILLFIQTFIEFLVPSSKIQVLHSRDMF